MKNHSVPCGGCTLCCQHDAVRLTTEDDPSQYLTEPHPHIHGTLMLAHGRDGNCIYLGAEGCSIHERAPSLCRSADCRELARSMSFERALALHKAGRLDLRIWDRGRRLLERAGALRELTDSTAKHAKNAKHAK